MGFTLKKMAAMKAMKAMKVMKAKKVSKIAKGKHMRAVVFSGSKEKTKTGLTKSDLIRNKSGKIVSRKASAAGKKRCEHQGLDSGCAEGQEGTRRRGLRRNQEGVGTLQKGKGIVQPVSVRS